MELSSHRSACTGPSFLLQAQATLHATLLLLMPCAAVSRFAMGITAAQRCSRNSICHLEGDKVVYPVGLFCAQYNCATKEVRC